MKYFKKEPITVSDIADESIWYNKKIKIYNGYAYFKEWEKLNILKIRDLVNEFGILMTHDELVKKYNISNSFLQTMQLNKSIPIEWKNKLKNTPSSLSPTTKTINIKINNKTQNLQKTTSKDFYWNIINLNTHYPKCISKWSEFLNNNESENSEDTIIWKHIFNRIFKLVRETKMQTFQYKITHRIIACKRWLFNKKKLILIYALSVIVK
jgi:hypothetical protein